MINYLGLDKDIIECVLEIDGSYKIGNFIPGTLIPVVNESILKKQPNYLILFSWHIKNELKKNLRKKKGFRGKFIIPLPYLK